MKARRLLPLIVGLLLILLFALIAARPQIFTDYGRKDMFGAWLPVSSEHILGTGALGYDIFTELVYGARDTLVTGIASGLLALALGLAIGILSASKGPVGSFFTGLTDIFVLIPRLVTLIVLSTFLGRSALNLTILIALFSWVGTARAVKAKVENLKTQPFIENCTIQGFGKAHIALFHILPNLADITVARFMIGVTSCIMMESSLSFLGFGDLYNPTWGTMINFAYKRGAFIRQSYNYLLTPALCIVLVSISFYLISLFFEQKQESISIR